MIVLEITIILQPQERDFQNWSEEKRRSFSFGRPAKAKALDSKLLATPIVLGLTH